MIGDFQNALSSMVAEGSLNQLLSAINKMQDYLAKMQDVRNQTFNGYQTAKAEYEASAEWGPEYISVPYAGDIPNPYRYTAMLALEAGKTGVRTFARQVATMNRFDTVFAGIRQALMVAGMSNDANNVDMTLVMIERFIKETTDRFQSVPEYNQTIYAIRDEFNRELAAQGIRPDDTASPYWMPAFMKSVDRIVPLDDVDTTPPSMSGLGELVGLALVLVWSIGIIAAAAMMAYTVSKLIDAWNSKAVTARELILKKADQKAALREKLLLDGKSEAEVKTVMEDIDAETDRELKNIPESGIGSTIATVAVLGVAALVAVTMINKKKG